MNSKAHSRIFGTVQFDLWTKLLGNITEFLFLSFPFPLNISLSINAPTAHYAVNFEPPKWRPSNAEF